MTRKDYELIAACIHAADFGSEGFERRLKLAQLFADNLALENPRFDRFKFIRACMMGQ
jgi:hypothetical protein